MKQCADMQVNNSNSFVIMNGQPQESKVITLHCPKCGNMLFNLGQFITTIWQAYDFLTSHKEEVRKKMPYCFQCGTELFYPELVEEIAEENA